MTKVFISQPMGNRSAEDILMQRRSIERWLHKKLTDDIEIIDTYFTDSSLSPLECLACSLKLLADADLTVFAPKWEFARGCRIEHQCCVDYGIPIMYIQ